MKQGSVLSPVLLNAMVHEIANTSLTAEKKTRHENTTGIEIYGTIQNKMIQPDTARQQEQRKELATK